MPSWSKGDTAFVLAVLTLGTMTSLALDRSLEAGGGVASTQPIGTITFKQKVAERRLSSQALWSSVQSRGPVYNFDTIRTGGGASAVVHLQDGTEVHLDEETMVGFEMKEKVLSLGLGRGSLAAKRARGAAPGQVSVVSQGVRVDFAAGAVSVAQSDAGLVLQADGQVSVTSGGQTSTLNDQAALVTAGSTPVAQAASLVSPAAEAYLVASGPGAVVFQWKSTGPSTLQVAKSAAFSTLVLESKTAVPEVRADLPEGNYYWRVIPAQGTPSLARHLVVLTSSAPAPREPQGLQRVADAQTALVPFAWSPAPHADTYRLEIFAGDDKTPLRTLRTSTNLLSVEGLPEGRYRWIVAASFSFADDELAGPAQTFEVRNAKTLEAPVTSPLRVLPETKAQFSLEGKTDARLSWEPVVAAEGYQVVIAKDPGFNQIVATVKATSNVASVPADLAQGDYYWRVQAIAQNLVSDPSEAQRFSLVSFLRLQGLFPKGQVSAGSLAVRWSDPNRGNRYRIDIASDPQFASLAASQPITVSDSRAARAARVRFDQPGRFFWKVSLFDADGTVQASSQPVPFLVTGGLAVPVLQEPAPTAVLDINAVADIRFRWTPVAGARLYRFELSRTVAGVPKLVSALETTEPTVGWRRWDLLAIASYQWKVTAVATDGNVDLQVSAPALGMFSLVRAQSLQAPTLRVPRVLYLPAVGP